MKTSAIWKSLVLLTTLLSCSIPLSAEQGDITVSFALGAFDVDTEDSDGPHLNDLSYNLLVGYNWSRFVALEAEFLHLEGDTDIDVFGELSAFGGQAAGVSIRLQWPFEEGIAVYLRAGSAVFRLDDAELLDEPLDEYWTQPMYGGGVRGRTWFVEYINYHKLDDYVPEQIRFGLISRF